MGQHGSREMTEVVIQILKIDLSMHGMEDMAKTRNKRMTLRFLT